MSGDTSGREKKHSGRGHILAIAFYAVLALGVTWPLVLHIADQVPGWAVGDNYEYLWKMWWFKHSLLDVHQNPLFAPHIAYPYGFALAHAELTPLLTLIGLPLTAFVGEISSYNAFLLLSYVLTGWATFALVHRLTGHYWAAILAGTVFALTPYHVVRCGGILPAASIEGIPLFFLGLDTWAQERRLRWALLAGVGFALSSWAYLYYALGLLLLAPVYTWARLGRVTRFARDRQTVTGLIVCALIMIAALAPQLVPYLQLGKQVRLAIPLEEVDFWAASFTDYLLPPGIHPIWGDWVQEQLLSVPADFPQIGREFILGLGYVTLLFAAYGARWDQSKTKRALVALLGVAFVLSLGPRLHIGRHPVLIPAPQKSVDGFNALMTTLGTASPSHESYEPLVDKGIAFPLPALALRWLLPPLLGLRGWNRFAVFVSFAAAVLAGLGFARWIDREIAPETMPASRKRRRARIASLIGLGLVLFELWPTPIALTPVAPRQVDLWLAEQPDQFTIIELPLVSALGAAQMQYTRYHGKRIAFAYGTYYPYWYRQSFPELSTCPQPGCLKRLREWDVRYVLLNRDATDREPTLESELERSPELRRVGQFDNITVFELLPAKPDG